MSVADALLGLLKVRPAHGYDLKLRYDALLDPSRSLQQAQVYATLSRLERDALVEVSGIDQGGGPPRRTFALTSLGNQELDRWLASPLTPAVQLHAVYSKVVLTAVQQLGQRAAAPPTPGPHGAHAGDDGAAPERGPGYVLARRVRAVSP